MQHQIKYVLNNFISDGYKQNSNMKFEQNPSYDVVTKLPSEVGRAPTVPAVYEDL